MCLCPRPDQEPHAEGADERQRGKNMGNVCGMEKDEGRDRIDGVRKENAYDGEHHYVRLFGNLFLL